MERSDAIDLAREVIADVLKGNVKPSEFARENTKLYDALREMKSCADDYKREAESAKRDLDATIPYVSGEPGRWNSLGNLQSTALRLEQLAAVFPIRAEIAKSELFDHFMRSEDATADLTAGDIAAAAETCEWAAGIDDERSAELEALSARLRNSVRS